MFAAHIRKNKYGEVEEEQSVREHCSGVMALAGQFGETLGVSDIIKCAALIHDLGKLTVDFNGYIHGINNFARGQIDHCFAGAKFINEYARKYDKHQYYDTAMLIARIVISHHKLHDWVNDNCENYFEQRIGKSDRYAEILKNKENVFSEEYIDDLFEKAVREYERLHERILEISERDRRKYCFYMGMLERLLQSMLVDADRIDTAEFMENKRIRLDYDINVVRNEMYNNIEKISAEFRTLTDRIAVYRMSISDRCAGFAGKKRGICRLVVPTGGGKTISSMRFAIHYCKQFNMDRIIYVAPFMSILEQNAKIIKSMVGDETLFLEFHSNIISRINNDEELHEYEMRTDLWDCPVIATTMVQLLNTLLSDAMTCVRRMHRLSKSVIIIDEVQSIPIKCVNLFKLSVNFLQKICGCTIVLCSATQPAFEDGKYGIRFDCEESMTGDFTEDFKNFKRTEIIPALRREQYSFEEAAEFCIDKFYENGNILMVVNTKKAASEIYYDINKKEITYKGRKAEIIHLSTSMCPSHRDEMLDKMRYFLKEKIPVICVTTQLIEAGVDISFRCVIRSLAGLDSAAQAAGRCNRHGESKCSPVYLINIKDENLSKLKQIKEAGDITMQLIGLFPNRLSDASVMPVYFKKLYRSFEDSMDYTVTINGMQTTILDLLSLNTTFNPHSNMVVDFNKAQAFATAGKKFEVISDNTLSLIVPYNDEARYIIERLNCDIDYIEQKTLLRRAQKYVVNIYADTAQKLFLQKGIYELNNKGIYAAEENFYDTFIGLTSEAAQQEFLCF